MKSELVTFEDGLHFISVKGERFLDRPLGHSKVPGGLYDCSKNDINKVKSTQFELSNGRKLLMMKDGKPRGVTYIMTP